MVQDVQIGHYNGSVSFGYWAVRFFDNSGSSLSLSYQLVRGYNVSKTLVSFRFQLWHLCDALSWSVSVRYQLVRRYHVSYRSVFLRTIETSQRRLKSVRLIHVAVATLWWRLSIVRNILTYMRPNWDVATTPHAGWGDSWMFVKENPGRKKNNFLFHLYLSV